MSPLSTPHSPEILASQHGPLGILSLNRPRVLNALTLEMVRLISAVLQDWRQDPSIRAIVLRGEGDKGFCAGGDVRTVWENGTGVREGTQSPAVPAAFFAEEYLLDRMLHHYPKPVIALMDGIVMGGGYGLAGACRYRIATETTRFAMPEVAIGLFPDVGSIWRLNRCPGYIGAYLALTGLSLHTPADLLYAGIATHFIPHIEHGRLLAFLEQGLNASPETDPEGLVTILDALISPFHVIPPAYPELANWRKGIDASFDHDTAEGILAAVAAEPEIWAKDALIALTTKSPTSIKVTLRHLREMAEKSFDEVIAADFRIVQHMLEGEDFYEGVRAQLIDKDKTPFWTPDSLLAVTDDRVDRYFRPARQTLPARTNEDAHELPY